MTLQHWVCLVCLLVTAPQVSSHVPSLKAVLQTSRDSRPSQPLPQLGSLKGGAVPTPTDTQTEPPQLTVPVRKDNPFQWQPTDANRLGVQLGDGQQALRIELVEPLSPAEAAGLNGGDRLLAVNGKALHSVSELRAVLSHKPQSVVLTIKPFVKVPGQEQQDVTVKLF